MTKQPDNVIYLGKGEPDPNARLEWQPDIIGDSSREVAIHKGLRATVFRLGVSNDWAFTIRKQTPQANYARQTYTAAKAAAERCLLELGDPVPKPKKK